MSDSIRILIVDDHPVVRDGLLAMLHTQPDFNVIEQAGDGAEALSKMQKHRPDVVLLDLEIPHMDGVEVLRRLDTAGFATNVIVFTAFDTDERIVGAIQAGARGYLLKGAPRDELFDAIRVASKGGSLLQPLIASKWIEKMNARKGVPSGIFKELTSRETDVLHLLAQGMTNKEIATELFITERTVKFHVSSILNKLGAGNRTEAVTVAAQHGLIEL